MEIKHKQDQNKGKFYIEIENKVFAEMTYSIAGVTLIIIDHTEVSEQLKGKSAGKQMLENLVDYARKNNIKVIPLCPFAKSVFEKSIELRDVLK